MVALLFPGQGSQSVGMGKAFYDTYDVAKQTFEEADEALGFKISDLCFEGDEAALKRTENTQPAILTTSIAAYRVFQTMMPDVKASFALGHSLGEWSALTAVGALKFADAVKLVNQRGRLMQEAVGEGEGAMSAIIGIDKAPIVETCVKVSEEGNGIVTAANFNGAFANRDLGFSECGRDGRENFERNSWSESDPVSGQRSFPLSFDGACRQGNE